LDHEASERASHVLKRHPLDFNRELLLKFGTFRTNPASPSFRDLLVTDGIRPGPLSATLRDLRSCTGRDSRAGSSEAIAALRQVLQGDTLVRASEAFEAIASQRARTEVLPDAEAGSRTGVFTTGIVSVTGDRRIALFVTGPRHAGENLATVLAHRAEDRAPPIQMCDALSRNTAGDFETIVANCIAHARRRYVDVATSFPEECHYVLETLGEVYRTDARARAEKLSPDERLHRHQEESGPRMEQLEKWLREKIEQQQVEPNSGLGEAIGYMREHWEQLTLFLRVPGVPLDNNICERALKKAILHRKNALFYKTENGAHVGDVFMSLIHTAELCEANPFEYLVALQKHADAVEADPPAWMPWNYTDALASLDANGDSPA